MKEQVKIFKKELDYIEDSKIREFTIKALESLPDYFWEIPSSSSGMYHPEYALGVGGLARHVKACVTIAKELSSVEFFKTNGIRKDMALSALFLHDGLKSGLNHNKNTVFEHPLLITEYIRENEELYTLLDKETLETILSGIESHMGQWCNSKYSKTVLPKPENGFQRFIHLCDYLASRKCLEVKFDI